MEKWVEIRRSGDFIDIANKLSVSPITARILRNRELKDIKEMEAYLSPLSGKLNDPMLLKGMKRVICVLKEKINANAKIRIIGDYDVDGICATYILFKGLTFFGADADYVIPHRIEDGYGINIKLIKDAYDAGRDTIITCDNGIAALKETDYANSLGLTMLVTDHHEVPYVMENGNREFKLPEADGIVDPKMPGETYPFTGICGAYVAFQTVVAYATENGLSENAEFMRLKEELLEFAALATVCDVMELKGENRTLVIQGMKFMEHSKNLGLSMLIRATGMEGRVLTPYHLGFVIGPCLNASGRLDTSLRALSLFTETDEEQALSKAEDLRTLNEERKAMTLSETEKAFGIVDSQEKLDKVLVVYLPDCHESLAGIIAGRVREKYTRPTFVITKTKEGLKGSGRSVDAYDMYEGLNTVSEYLTKFGGHKLAAGISLKEEDLEAFTAEINEKCVLRDEDFFELVRIDMELPFEYATINLARELERLEPFGNGNDKPLFALRNVKILNGRLLGSKGNASKYRVLAPSGRTYEMVYFGDVKSFAEDIGKIYGDEAKEKIHTGQNVEITLDVLYEISINTYRGVDSVQLLLKHYR